jgi:hypothetical protein
MPTCRILQLNGVFSISINMIVHYERKVSVALRSNIKYSRYFWPPEGHYKLPEQYVFSAQQQSYMNMPGVSSFNDVRGEYIVY